MIILSLILYVRHFREAQRVVDRMASIQRIEEEMKKLTASLERNQLRNQRSSRNETRAGRVQSIDRKSTTSPSVRNIAVNGARSLSWDRK